MELRLVRVVQSNRQDNVAQIAKNVCTDSDRKMSEYTLHHSLLYMGLQPALVTVPLLPTSESANSEYVCITTTRKSSVRSEESYFLFTSCGWLVACTSLS